MMGTEEYGVVSVMGPHAGEDSAAIFTRKMADVRNAGRTFWLIRSYKAKADTIQMIASIVCKKSSKPFCAFLAPSLPGGATPTKTASAAAEYSIDRLEWRRLPVEITPVTGRIGDNTCALVFDQLSLRETTVVDLWQYADFLYPDQPVIIRQGASTVGVVRADTSMHPRRMKSRLRQVVAIGRMVEPFAVWLR
jgi:hypothetical protein